MNKPNNPADNCGSSCCSAAIEDLEAERREARRIIWEAAREFGPREYRRLCDRTGQVPSVDGEANFVDGFASGLFSSRAEFVRAEFHQPKP